MTFNLEAIRIETDSEISEPIATIFQGRIRVARGYRVRLVQEDELQPESNVTLGNQSLPSGAEKGMALNPGTVCRKETKGREKIARLVDIIEERVLAELTAQHLPAPNESDVHRLVSTFGRVRALRTRQDQAGALTATEAAIFDCAAERIEALVSGPAHGDLRGLEELAVSVAKLQSIMDGGPYGFTPY